MKEFDKCVFVNCPFDPEFRQLMLAMVFTIMRLDFKPRLALERNNSAETRIRKIVDLIRESKFGLHDLSRMESTEVNELVRMNMPFELGIDVTTRTYPALELHLSRFLDHFRRFYPRPQNQIRCH